MIGVNELKLNQKFNTAFVISKKGGILAEYHKKHMLPGLESGYNSDPQLSLFSFNKNLVGVGICKDMDFSHQSSCCP